MMDECVRKPAPRKRPKTIPIPWDPNQNLLILFDRGDETFYLEWSGKGVWMDVDLVERMKVPQWLLGQAVSNRSGAAFRHGSLEEPTPEWVERIVALILKEDPG